MTSFTLSPAAALAWSGAQEQHKGRPYVRELTGLSARPEGGSVMLRGVAYGQEPYQVRATLAGGQVTSARCSCPVGGGGHCKHVAALLLRASGDPGSFSEVPELSSVLDGLSVPELHGLIARMLDRAPELEALVYASSAASVNAPAGSAREQIEAAFDVIRREYNPEWDHEGEGPDTEAVELILEGADALLENLDALDAAWAAQVLDTYLAVLDEVEDTYDGDFDWGLDELQEWALGAVQVLVVSDKLPDDARAEATEAVLCEVAAGRVNLEEDTFLAYADALRPDEREELLELLRERMRTETYDYQRQAYARALYRLREDELGEVEAERLLRAGGDLNALLDFLLKCGRAADAQRAVREAGHRAMFSQLEPVFEAHSQLSLLEDLARERLESPDARFWLYERYAATGRNAEAHALAREEVARAPSELWLTHLKAVSPDWETERAEIIRRLWPQPGHAGTLLALLLRERLPEEALRLISERENVQPGPLLRLAEQLDPVRAAPLIVRAAQQYIDGRNRGAYHEAAQILGRLPALVGREEAAAQVRAVVARQPRLPALRDELRQAGLL